MASEGTFTVPRMGSFKRAFLGYRRHDVDAAMTSRDTLIWGLERDVADVTGMWRAVAEDAARSEMELQALSGMVIEREREIRSLSERLREANERHERNIGSLESVAGRLEEIHAQARGQATRIRMKALREAVEVSRRAQELVEAQSSGDQNGATDHSDGQERIGTPDGTDTASAGAAASPAAPDGIFQGKVTLEIGPLGDFSQLVGFEDAIGRLGASAISVERFSEGRATISVRLDEPVKLLQGLEEALPLDFDIRRSAGDNVVLEIHPDRGPEQQAA
jgi:hypothetical protein